MNETPRTPSEHFDRLSSTRQLIFASRTLNMRSIAAIGYDMDYTLVHYNMERWEERAYRRLKELLHADGWPVAHLSFDPDLVIRGLVIDTELGNLVKANRFGYVTRAAHGTRLLSFDEQREAYRHTPVDLAEPRFFFLNTLFSASFSCLYSQLVDLYDQQRLPELTGYEDLFRRSKARFDQTHVEGIIKDEIMAGPEPFVDLDPKAPLALLDQKNAGKKMMLISNAGWRYARSIMSYAYDQFLPPGMCWKDLFDLVIVSARKPDFFAHDLQMFKVVDEEAGLLRPLPGPIPGPGVYLGGDAGKVEDYLGVSGAEILYVGDHIYADVHMSKSILRWRTALILRELEQELDALGRFRGDEIELEAMMATKEWLESEHCHRRLDLQRMHMGYGPQPTISGSELERTVGELRGKLEEIDQRISPLARNATQIYNRRWGPLLRAGNDKSHLARQLERSADIYTSRVSNFLHATPFAYLRSKRGSMPHDP